VKHIEGTNQGCISSDQIGRLVLYWGHDVSDVDEVSWSPIRGLWLLLVPSGYGGSSTAYCIVRCFKLPLPLALCFDVRMLYVLRAFSVGLVRDDYRALG
jgi:hypothetical protein